MDAIHMNPYNMVGINDDKISGNKNITASDKACRMMGTLPERNHFLNTFINGKIIHKRIFPILSGGTIMAYNILLVDDDKEFREELRDYLHEYGVLEASSGEDALQVLKKPNEVDLVIMDVMMPGMRGTEVLKKIKIMYPDMGIIMLTGYSSVDLAVESFKEHADDYLEKPLKIDKVKNIIEGLLDKKCAKDGIDADSNEGKINLAKQFIRRNYQKKLTLADLAQKTCLSPKYFSRFFRKHAGMGYNEYKIKLKMEEAKSLLNKTSCNINQVSDKLGYENTESFIRQFKKLTGRTPVEYRVKIKSSKDRKRT